MSILHDNKFIQSLLKKLLQCGSKAIRKRSVQEESDPPDQALESIIIKIFSQLLDENYNINTFKQQIIKKRISPKPGAKKIVQLLYNFIYIIKVGKARITVNQITLMSQDIIKMIGRLNKRSRFFPFRLHLKTKILQLTKVKSLYFSDSSSSEITEIRNNIVKYLNPFTKESVLNVQNAIRVLEVFNENVALIPPTSPMESSLLETFFEDLNSKCQSFIRDEKYVEDSEQINMGMKSIISEINILSGQLDSTKDIPSFDKCLESCKRLRYLSKSSKDKFNYNEKNRDNKSYSFESFEKILSLHQGAIARANSLLAQNDFNSISDDVLSKYRDMISKKNKKILDRKFYDQQMKNMKLDVEKAMEQAASKSTFGKSAPTSDKILDKILGLF